jgi:hypothetical protein
MPGVLNAATPAVPGTVTAYPTAHAGTLKVSTLSRRLSAIRAAHDRVGEPLDLASSHGFREVWTGIKSVLPGTAVERPSSVRAGSVDHSSLGSGPKLL